MNTLSARDNYHKTHDEKQRSELAQLLNSTPVKTAMIFAMAHLAELGATREQLNGARSFCLALLNLPSVIEPQSEFKPETLERVKETPDGR